MSLFAGRVAVAAGVVAGAAIGKQAGAGADVIYHPTSTAANGKTVYLSVACHDTNDGYPGGACIPNSGCGGHNENNWSKAAATSFADYGYGLVWAGYKTIVGTGTRDQNIANSNANGAGTHIPVHSNADVAVTGASCARTGTGDFGTWAMHYPNDSNQIALSYHMLARVGTSSLGTGDQLVPRSQLPELFSVDGVASYLEADFHTWNAGSKWLADYNTWGWRVRWAVDGFWDFP
ncbi:MAG TPA: hypothetical protein VF228_04940 [Iamia sp.]